MSETEFWNKVLCLVMLKSNLARVAVSPTCVTEHPAVFAFEVTDSSRPEYFEIQILLLDL